jgi:hypothetical protein
LSEGDSQGWDSIGYGILIDVNSAFDEGVDYSVEIKWNKTKGMWTRVVEEISSSGSARTLNITDNYSNFYGEDALRKKGYVNLNFDLGVANYPNQYNIIFYTYTDFNLFDKHYNCYDISNWLSVPPPDFIISTSQSPLELRPGEEKNINLNIQSKTNINSQVLISVERINDNIQVNPYPDLLSILPLANATYTLVVNATHNAIPGSYTIPLSINMSFPRTVDVSAFGQSFGYSNQIISTINKNSYLTITILPKLTTEEHLNNFVNSWINPISGLWTFLAGVGAVIAPLIIRMYSKKQMKSENKKLDDYSKKE